MKKRISICIIILLCLILLIGIFIRVKSIYENPIISPDQEHLIEQIERIAKKHTKRNTWATILSKEEVRKSEEKKIYDCYQYMGKNDFVLEIHGAVKWYQDLSSPSEVYGAVETLLYLNSIKTPFDVAAVAYEYSQPAIDTLIQYMCVINGDEFEELYNMTDITGLSKEQVIKLLGDEWIRQTGYIRNRSENPEKWDQERKEEEEWRQDRIDRIQKTYEYFRQDVIEEGD